MFIERFGNCIFILAGHFESIYSSSSRDSESTYSCFSSDFESTDSYSARDCEAKYLGSVEDLEEIDLYWAGNFESTYSSSSRDFESTDSYSARDLKSINSCSPSYFEAHNSVQQYVLKQQIRIQIQQQIHGK